MTLCFCGWLLGQTSTPMVTIKGGSYVPLYGVKGENKATKPVNVKSFQLDIYPVTNAQSFFGETPRVATLSCEGNLCAEELSFALEERLRI